MTRIGAGLWGQFQFTPLREGRPGCQSARSWRFHFNSRPSARGDTMQPEEGAGLR